ncbi:MAG: ASCH domain-containing protein [Anaerolineae bacterium]|nr:ASCH domain-containing protein [Anaerolineae bacterium]
MSFALTTRQYQNKTKSVTRRNGWKFAKVGDMVNGCEKCQGLKRGERITVLGQHRWVCLRWEPLRRMTDDLEYGKREVNLEGFPEMTPQEFVDMYCKHNKVTPDALIHRMEFEYL